MDRLPVVAIRPEPGLSATLRKARDAGMDVRGEALFDVQPVAWTPPDPARYRGLLAGSANLFRHGGAGLGALRALPVHAVGAKTADAARDAGFAVASTGEGGLQAVAEALAPGHYLRLAGEARVDLALSPQVHVDTVTAYRVARLPMSDALAKVLRGGAVMLLHSGEAARHFATACDTAGIERARISLACLAPRIAQAAGTGWARVECAGERSDAALLALADQMCQTR
ncbi:uroporphyrinogen-III synthase [Novosphingobium sp. ZN18A2]|uniref:uroporphyrinogen-III synthase n=1 Tax=Novosphingobium sp. ZN18A2 TaxID=3079861 RepID=UPI0030D452DB